MSTITAAEAVRAALPELYRTPEGAHPGDSFCIFCGGVKGTEKPASAAHHLRPDCPATMIEAAAGVTPAQYVKPGTPRGLSQAITAAVPAWVQEPVGVKPWTWDQAVGAYFAALALDYRKFREAMGPQYAATIEEDVAKFRRHIVIKLGRKFARVSTGEAGSRSCHSFIEIATGDIWKAASWKAPALNFKRGNVYAPEGWAGHITWTGAQ